MLIEFVYGLAVGAVLLTVAWSKNIDLLAMFTIILGGWAYYTFHHPYGTDGVFWFNIRLDLAMLAVLALGAVWGAAFGRRFRTGTELWCLYGVGGVLILMLCLHFYAMVFDMSLKIYYLTYNLLFIAQLLFFTVYSFIERQKLKAIKGAQKWRRESLNASQELKVPSVLSKAA